MLASSRNTSVGFAVFADQSRSVAAKIHVWPKQGFELLTATSIPAGELPLYQAAQKAAAGLAIALCTAVKPLQEVVGNGDHHLGHRVSIYGIDRRQSGHAEEPDGSGRTRGTRNVPIQWRLAAKSGSGGRGALSSQRRKAASSGSPAGSCLSRSWFWRRKCRSSWPASFPTGWSPGCPPSERWRRSQIPRRRRSRLRRCL